MNYRKAVEFMMPQIKNLIRTAHIQADAAYGILRKGFKLTPYMNFCLRG